MKAIDLLVGNLLRYMKMETNCAPIIQKYLIFYS